MSGDADRERPYYYGPSAVGHVMGPPPSRPSLVPLQGTTEDRLMGVLERIYGELSDHRKAILVLDEQGQRQHEAMTVQLDRIEAAVRKAHDSIPDLVTDAVSEATGPHAVPYDAVTPNTLEAALNARALLEQARNADKRCAELEKLIAKGEADADLARQAAASATEKRIAERRAWWRGLALAVCATTLGWLVKWVATGHP